MRRERLKNQKEIEENSLIQKIIIEETNEGKENERSNYTVCEYLDLIEKLSSLIRVYICKVRSVS
tara:strand:+ start:103 stop:297 length:195 start_codon:yes stop_codon:yes gene_type:complete